MTVQTGPLQIRRLTTAQLATVVPAIGEPVYNKTTNQFRLGDGVTVGGLLLGSPLTTYAATFLTSTDSATARTTLVAAQRGANSDITSLSGLTTALSVAQGGTGSTTAATARTALSAAVSGANNDITSLTGLTTPLSVAQGGTGVTTVAAQLTALQTAGAYGKTNILGTVSQTSGVPTGAIIETGTNANGRYIKYADGTMICTFTNATATTTPNANGSLFQSVDTAFTFPVAFIAQPTVTFNTQSAVNTPCWVASAAAAHTTTTCAVRLFSLLATGQSIISYIAVGRWF